MMRVLGIDVSHHNGQVDWFSVARTEVRFAYAKATDGGTFVDPQFAANWPGIRDAGLLRGAYHFGRPGSDPEAQAVQFASVVGPLSWGALPPVLDLEVMEGQGKQGVIDWTLAFLSKADALFGCPLVIYTGGLWRHQLGAPAVGRVDALADGRTGHTATREPLAVDGAVRFGRAGRAASLAQVVHLAVHRRAERRRT